MALKEILPMLWTKELRETMDFNTLILCFSCGEFNKK